MAFRLLETTFRWPSDDWIDVAEQNVNSTTRCLNKDELSSARGGGYNTNFYADSDPKSMIRIKVSFNAISPCRPEWGKEASQTQGGIQVHSFLSLQAE